VEGVGLVIRLHLFAELALELRYQTMSLFSRGKAVPADNEVVLNVLLNCELTKSSETKQIHFQSLPTTPLEIKKKIEEDFSIPSCVQTLHYQSMILKDSDQLQHTHFRSGDTFTVDYPIEAECEVIQNVIKWLNELLKLLQSIKESVISPDEENDLLISSAYQKVRNLIRVGQRDDIINAFSVTLFFPWRDKQLMNKYYFQQEGGLDVLMRIYRIVTSAEWGDPGIDRELHNIYLEQKCCLAVCNYAQTLPLLRQVVLLGGLETCIVTLLRRQLQGERYSLATIVYNTLKYALYAVNK
jgi:hypothetical protein